MPKASQAKTTVWATGGRRTLLKMRHAARLKPGTTDSKQESPRDTDTRRGGDEKAKPDKASRDCHARPAPS